MQFDKIYVLWLKIAKFLKRKKKKEMCAFDVRELIVCMCMCVLTIIKQWSSKFGKSFIELHLKSQWFWILWIATHCECMRRSWNKWAAISIYRRIVVNEWQKKTTKIEWQNLKKNVIADVDDDFTLLFIQVISLKGQRFFFFYKFIWPMVNG